MDLTVSDLIAQANEARRAGDTDRAHLLASQAVELGRSGTDHGELARALAALAQSERDQGHPAAALECYSEAAYFYRSIRQSLRLAHTVRHIADIHREAERRDLAEPFYREALFLYREAPEAPALDLANALRGYALLKEESGDMAGARRFWEEAGGLYAAAGVQPGAAEAARRLSYLRQP